MYHFTSFDEVCHICAGDKFILKMRFIDHVFDDQVVDHMTLRVILPEGSKNVKLVPPYYVERGADELHYTYLDTMGRPVIVASKADLTDGHIQDFEVGVRNSCW